MIGQVTKKELKLFSFRGWGLFITEKDTFPQAGHSRSCCLQSAKILLLLPKYEIIMVISNLSNFQYCVSNIGLLSIAPCKVITLDPLCILFRIGSLLLF